MTFGDLLRPVRLNQFSIPPELVIQLGNIAEVNILIPGGGDLPGS